jgi:dipeptidyl aminopeptidase/acylaminoacyl peptidase
LYTLTSMDSPDPAIYAASLANPADKIRLLPNASQAQYASADNSEDYLLWLRDGTLVAQRFNAEGLKFIGEAHSLAEGAALVSAGSRVLLYGPGALRQLKWLDRKGNELGLLGEPGPWAWLHMSLDGRRVATLGTDIKHRGIWLLETNRGVASRLTAGFGLNPIWSPDGKAILWSTSKGISRVDAASGTEEQVMESPNIQTVNDWSRDGRFILYAETSPETARDLWVLPVTRDGRPAPGVKGWSFVRDSFNQANARFSPDTHWVAYQSDESGEWQAYIRSFPEPHEKLQVSTGGGSNPQWGSSSRELFYQSRSGKLMAVTLTPAGASLSASLPRELFPLPAGIVGPNPYEAAADGQRFLVDYPASKPEPLNVIVNWPALLKKGAPAP